MVVAENRPLQKLRGKLERLTCHERYKYVHENYIDYFLLDNADTRVY